MKPGALPLGIYFAVADQPVTAGSTSLCTDDRSDTPASALQRPCRSHQSRGCEHPHIAAPSWLDEDSCAPCSRCGDRKCGNPGEKDVPEDTPIGCARTRSHPGDRPDRHMGRRHREPELARRTSDVMPMRVIRPIRSLPPLDFCSGVSPSDAANCRPDRKRSGSLTDAARAVADMIPTPGIVASRCDSSFARCQASSSFSSVASRCREREPSTPSAMGRIAVI